MSQVVLPLLELLFVLVNSTDQLHDKIDIHVMEMWLNVWEIHMEDNVLYSDHRSFMETAYSIRIARKSLDRLARMVGVALERFTKPSNQSRARADLPSPLKWHGQPVVEPHVHERHDNDDPVIAEIQILPTHQEIMSPRDPVLPGNCYFSEDAHWLPIGPERLFDTHFRLLREDMLGDVRDCLRTLTRSIEQGSVMSGMFRQQGGQSTLYVYPNAQLAEIVASPWRGFLYRIKFEWPSRIHNTERRLKSGVLICLIIPRSNGGHQLNFGSVASYKGSDSIKKTDTASVYVILHSYELVIDMSLLLKNQRQNRFYLVEAGSVLVDAYQGVLKALKGRNPATLPFLGYICPPGPLTDSVEIEPPLYATARGFTFNLKAIREGCSLKVGDIYQNQRTYESLQHDLTTCQCDALVGALTSEFAFIQGPPGTGKTFIGVRIAKVLLDSNAPGPILVVCYTNHALDQFLKKLIELGVPSNSVARVGSRSEDPLISSLQVPPLTNKTVVWKTAEAHEKCVSVFREPTFEDCLAFVKETFPSAYSSLKSGDDGFRKMGKNQQEFSLLEKWLRSQQDSVDSISIDSLEDIDGIDMWSLTEKSRQFVIDQLRELISRRRRDYLILNISSAERAREHLSLVSDIEMSAYLKNKRVVGMTTSGAAAKLEAIEQLSPRVIICEEASEVLEAHLLAFLSNSTQHLIAIGDHLQLRPHIAKYSLSMENPRHPKYCLDLSQFERLQGPGYGFPSFKLSVQRRMRPDFSTLIRQTVYPFLQDGIEVTKYPSVKGVTKNLLFVNHDHQEAARKDGATSYTNHVEAQFAVQLTRHLLLQGYPLHSITILTPYVSQLIVLRNLLRESTIVVEVDVRDEEQLEELGLNDENTNIMSERKTLGQCIRVATVDNYQGEENDIVIISTVRNVNPDGRGSIGFLSTPNRVNVMLSRARYGMFIFGNADLLRAKSEMWGDIIDMMEDQGAVSNSIEICCAKHPSFVRAVTAPDMFAAMSPDGGCLERCTIRLPNCGHRCPRLCHSNLPDHQMIMCSEPCPRQCSSCLVQCRKLCGENCGDCKNNVGTVELHCGHAHEDTMCYLAQDVGRIKCLVPVERVLDDCGHKVTMKCSSDVKSFRCNVRCSAPLPCGHECKVACAKHSQDKDAHPKCFSQCGRNLNCGHPCAELCHDENVACRCFRKCEIMVCDHSHCAHACGMMCCPCISKCNNQCPHTEACPLVCGAPCLRVPCDMRCDKKLKCGHQCPSLCGEICPDSKYCHKCGDDESVKSQQVDMIMFQSYEEINLDELPVMVLTCGHIFTVETLDHHTSLTSFYNRRRNGSWDTENFPLPENMTKVPSCIACHRPITKLKRYWRVIRKGMLDSAEKVFTTNTKLMLKFLSEAVESNVYTSEIRQKSLLKRFMKGIDYILRSPTLHVLQACKALLGAEQSHLENQLPSPASQHRQLGDSYMLLSHYIMQLFINPDVTTTPLEEAGLYCDEENHHARLLSIGRKQAEKALESYTEGSNEGLQCNASWLVFRWKYEYLVWTSRSHDPRMSAENLQEDAVQCVVIFSIYLNQPRPASFMNAKKRLIGFSKNYAILSSTDRLMKRRSQTIPPPNSPPFTKQ